MDNFNSALYNILEWIMKFAYVNILWILFTLLGGIILGFYPSTIAMFAIIRDWLHGKTELPIFKTYWIYFKRDFAKSNILGLIINVLIALIVIDVYYIQTNMNEQLTWTHIPLFSFMLLVILLLFYLFPSFVHYSLNLFQLIKNAFLIMLISPLNSFLMILCLGSIYFIMKAVPALFFIFGGSIYAYITTWLSLNTFYKIQKKQAKG